MTAVTADDSRMLERFTRLCEISSPTGQERAVADVVLDELRSLGVAVREDDCAQRARAGAGNLIATLPAATDDWLMFCAHLDTVPHEGPIEVLREGGVFRSRGETILGADNKAAVAVLLELAARHSAASPPIGLELVFTVAEEDGLRGATALDVSSLRAPHGFILDHASPIGEVIVAAPTYKRLVAEFTGVEAHAGIRPEDGRSAIAAAAAAIGAMELGRLDDQTTANVGVIEGGTATNVVPASCRVEAEARSIDGVRAAELIGSMVEACLWGAGEHGCDVQIDSTELFRGYKVDPSMPAVALVSEALARRGIEPRLTHTGGGSDVNALLAAGFDCVLLANGTEANHTPEESVTEAAIVEMLGVCEEIIALAAQTGPPGDRRTDKGVGNDDRGTPTAGLVE